MGIGEILASIVITVKNEGKNLPQLMEVLMKGKEEFEIIIVDSQSTDETKSIMEKIVTEKPI